RRVGGRGGAGRRARARGRVRCAWLPSRARRCPRPSSGRRMSEVVFVGTSDAFGAGGRRQSAIFARGERGGMLLDCGATTNTGLAQLGIPRDEVDVILISHFHGDHFGGIPAFLYAALYSDRRRHPLDIVGPPEIEA